MEFEKHQKLILEYKEIAQKLKEANDVWLKSKTETHNLYTKVCDLQVELNQMEYKLLGQLREELD